MAECHRPAIPSCPHQTSHAFRRGRRSSCRTLSLCKQLSPVKVDFVAPDLTFSVQLNEADSDDLEHLLADRLPVHAGSQRSANSRACIALRDFMVAFAPPSRGEHSPWRSIYNTRPMVSHTVP